MIEQSNTLAMREEERDLRLHVVEPRRGHKRGRRTDRFEQCGELLRFFGNQSEQLNEADRGTE